MLPTTGYFKDIECPFWKNDCDRPYCHFRHKKKNAETAESSKKSSTEGAEVPTYNPTPKSQLANPRNQSHIPIQYVPDLAGLSDRSNRKLSSVQLPTYKPTPLSILSNSNKLGTYMEENTKATTSENVSSNKFALNYPSVAYDPSESRKNENDINFEDLSTEFDMIDEIINDFDDVQTEDCINDEEIPVVNKPSKDEGKNSKKRSKTHEKEHQKDKKSHKKEDKNDKSHDERKHKHERTNDKKSTHDNAKEKSSSSKHKEKERSRHSSDKRSSNKHSSVKHSSDKHNSDKHSSDKHSNKDKQKSKHHDKKHSKEKEKSKRHKQESKKISKSSDSESGRNNEYSSSEIESEEKIKSQHKLQTKDLSHLKYKQNKNEEIKQIESDDGFSDNDFNNIDDYDSEDDTLQECYKIFNEYVPEKPQMIQEPTIINSEMQMEETNVGKKRVAHDKAENMAPKIMRTAPKAVANPAQTMNNRFKVARQIQANNEQKNIIDSIKAEVVKKVSSSSISRTQIIQKHKPQNNSKSESLPRKTVVNKQPEQTVSLVDSIIAGNAKPRRIAPVQNVNSLQRAKARIEEMARQKAAATIKKTLPQTVSKGASRVAHTPEFSLSDLPDVLQADKSKLPVNVRTRYLTMIVDECMKLYLTKEDAYERALNEEFKCYERCKVLVTYRNSAMLSINRLRKEAQEREKAGLGPMASGEEVKNDGSSEFKGRKFYENIKQYVLTEEELILHGYPRESEIPGHAVIPNKKSSTQMPLDDNERICCRCSKLYFVDDNGFAINDEQCIYHPLKKRTLRGERTYLCCKSSDDSGCVTSDTHVSEMSAESELEGYQTTMEPDRENDPRSFAVYALDCEMCYTTKGLELTRVTIVDVDCKTVYESFVQPLNPIIDYNTRFSGITKEQMDRTSTSILQVQANILHLCNSKTILIGHSLESDMKALKIVHSSIIDTSVLFPHKFGLPHKRALRSLAGEYLKKIIQNDISGHDSAEDALTCMELVIWKVKEDLKVRGLKV